MREFEELRIRVRRIGAGRYLALANGPANAVTVLDIGGHPAELRRSFEELIDIELGRAPRASGGNTETRIRELGRAVFGLLIDDELDACVSAARAKASALRLRFDLPPELHGLPVEALHSPADDPQQSLALDANVSVTRSLSMPRATPPGSRLPTGDDQHDRIRLLVAVASPSDLYPVEFEAELAALDRALPRLAVEQTVCEHATLKDIESWLDQHANDPSAVLLIAHGAFDEDKEYGVVLLESDDGRSHRVPSDLFSGILVQARQLRLVMLNLCSGAQTIRTEPFAGLAQGLIGRGIPAVVGMSGRVTDHAAIAFSSQLLSGICSNRTIDEAMTGARHHIANMREHTAIEWVTPQLYLHDGYRHGWLFKAREVHDDNATVQDPLRLGEEAIAALEGTGNLPLTRVLAAARFQRTKQDWNGVLNTLHTGRRADEQDRLITEARIELAWPVLEKTCACLAAADPDGAAELLAGQRHSLPAGLIRRFEAEIEQARALRGLVAQARQAEAENDLPRAVDCYRQVLEQRPAGFDDVSGRSITQVYDRVFAKATAAEEAQDWAAASACYETLPADYGADLTARSRYVRARLAEAAGDWPLAERLYGETRHADAETRRGYAQGRLAEEAGDWDLACRHYTRLTSTGLTEKLLDVGQRTRYAMGRSADARGDWAEAIEGFGELPDDFADGEVGRRRRFGRAKIAAADADWRSVLAHLGNAEDEERDGLVAITRREARGRLAELDNDWAAAVAAYAPATAADPNLRLAHRYAGGRLAESVQDFRGALTAYADLPDGYRDTPVRRQYAQARLAEEEPADWDAIAASYSALPDDFEDAGLRSAYARLRSAVADEDWDRVLGPAEQLGAYRDTGLISSYARGRLAEAAGDWPAAITAYQGCAGYADAADRHAYATGRELESAGSWSAAITAYDQVPGTDGEHRRDRLAELLSALPWADGLAGAELVADPAAQRDGTFPYRALRAANITPASTTKSVQDAAYTLMERGGLSWQERLAWDQLRTPAKRLLQDARLFRFQDPEALRQKLATLEPGADLSSRLCAGLPADAPLLTLLTGDRPAAITAWRRQLMKTPADMVVVHSLAVASFWQARELEDSGAWEHAEQVWRESLACWAVVLADDGYWIGWRQARAACYGHAVTPADTARMRADLGRYLVDLLAEQAQRHADAGRPQQAAGYRGLVLMLEPELAAARTLSEVGGLPLPDDPAGTLACGPGYLRMIGRAKEFGEFVAVTDAAHGTGPESAAALRRLRWSFGELSGAFSLLEHRQVEAALAELPEFHRHRLSELPDDCADPENHGQPQECGHCQDFLDRNPAYTYLPKRRARLLWDAVELAVRAHLRLAQDLLTTGQIGEAMTELAEAITVAANATISVRTRDAALRIVLGRVDALAELGLRRFERLEEAITLVQQALPVIGARGESALRLAWADLLVDSGIWYGTACREAGLEPDFEQAVGLLRKALELNPESAKARDQLARALTYGLDELPGGRSAVGRLAILREAFALVHDGLRISGMSNRLLECLGDVLEELVTFQLASVDFGELRRMITSYGEAEPEPTNPRARARALAGEAARLGAAGEGNRAIHALVRAIRLDPDDEDLRVRLLALIDEELANRGWTEG